MLKTRRDRRRDKLGVIPPVFDFSTAVTRGVTLLDVNYRVKYFLCLLVTAMLSGDVEGVTDVMLVCR